MKKLLPFKTQSFTISETLSNYYLLIALFSFVFLLSCGGDDNDTPAPVPVPVVKHTINIDGNVKGAVYAVFDEAANNELDGDTAIMAMWCSPFLIKIIQLLLIVSSVKLMVTKTGSSKIKPLLLPDLIPFLLLK